jgi:nucleotide-binding universal stress UspA family protein
MILLAVDGSDHAQAAVEILCDLPMSEGSSVTALSVLIPREAGVKYAPMKSVLEHTKARMSEIGLEVTTELMAGYPANVLNDFSCQRKPDLVVLGAKGLRATLGILLGGVAQQVVEYACSPVMVVRAPYESLQKVLLVTDGSPHSQQAMEYLAKFPLPEEAKVELMHVMPPLLTPDLIARSWPIGVEVASPAMLSVDIEEDLLRQAEAEEEDAKALLDRVQRAAAALGLEVETVLRRGDAATEIIDYTKEAGVDLIVAGSRGLSQVTGWLLGSVSRKIIHYASCSVLVVKSIEGAAS